MNLPFFIARKYFLSGKEKNFINVISIISMVMVAIGTMCLIVALSVFNGLEGLLRSIYGDFDPEVIVAPSQGKSFKISDELLKTIQSTEGVVAITQVVEDNVLVKFKEAQRVVRMKGMSEAFVVHSDIQHSLVSGHFSLVQDSIEYALIGRGIQYDLSLNLNSDFYSLQVYYPKNIVPGVVNPEKLYTLKNIIPGGIFAIEKYYDENFIFVPLTFAIDLLGYGDKRSTLELILGDNVSATQLKKNLQDKLGNAFLVKTGDELHSGLYKILKIEKLFVFIIFTLIIGIASINIFFSLTMLVIEKKKHISVLIAQGASTRSIRNIFLYEGGIVAFTGASIGLLLGLVISFVQQEFGLIGMGMERAVMSVYPVKIEWMDVILTAVAVIFITMAISVKPAIKASKSFSSHTLQ